ncbi:MAG: sigma-70 family RNA polymerase sigma factor [Microcella sp.]|uniref:RNA polymerase sigma factor n=1 Tax=Microcella sp. TaxID=1913979 RepID=UPI0024C984D8|nr:sigma-70 family RNA polymerase sigma factor [Microcella sp.]UYN84723.1 MAG: sigma-70 family RNA polymerase sigma factor [Microcella sp.]
MTARQGASGESFASVLAAAQAGASWACTRLWNDHSPAVAAFAAARGSREPDDLTSEVFLAVFDRLPQFRGDLAAFRSFVFSIAYRRLVDELRMRGRRGETVELIAEDDPRRASSAEDEALASLGDQRVIALLRALPSDQRDVMQLRIVADLTVEQISVVLGKRPAAVKALQRRALERLRKKFGDTRTPAGPSSDSD